MARVREICEDLLPARPISTAPWAFPCGISRSGTTLLAAVLDAHSRIHLGYELVSPRLPGVDHVLRRLEEGMRAAEGDFSRAGSKVRAAGDRETGQWLARCHRAGAGADEVREALEEHRASCGGRISTFRERLRLAFALIEKVERPDVGLRGFKFPGSRFEAGRRAFPAARFIYILRDPRDVVVSQREREFDRTLEVTCADWNVHLRAFERFQRRHPRISLLIRYEDLVSRPRETVERLFALLGLEPEPGVLEFQDSKAGVLRSRHPNAENLRKGFFTGKIGRHREELPAAERATIEALCDAGMARHGYGAGR